MGKQYVNNPLFHKDDRRLISNSYNGITINSIQNIDNFNIYLTAGYLQSMNGYLSKANILYPDRNTYSNFYSLSESVGISENQVNKNGAVFAGISLENDSFTTELYASRINDLIQNWYLLSSYTLKNQNNFDITLLGQIMYEGQIGTYHNYTNDTNNINNVIYGVGSLIRYNPSKTSFSIAYNKVEKNDNGGQYIFGFGQDTNLFVTDTETTAKTFGNAINNAKIYGMNIAQDLKKIGLTNSKMSIGYTKYDLDTTFVPNNIENDTNVYHLSYDYNRNKHLYTNIIFEKTTSKNDLYSNSMFKTTVGYHF